MIANHSTIATLVARGRQADLLGKRVQLLALAELARQGAVCLQLIASPCIVVRGRKRFTSKVVGDISGVWPGGRAILCECKARTVHGVPRRPIPSDFEPHQVAALRAMDEARGSALVAYLGLQGLLIEPAVNFFKGKP